MALVKAPNGDVYDLNDSVASGLVGGSGGWSYAKSAPAGRNSKGNAKASVESDVEASTPEEAEVVTEIVEPVEDTAAEEANK